MAEPRILVVCGTGIATSTVVVRKLEEFFKARGVNAQIRQAKVLELNSQAGDVDLIVSTTPVPAGTAVPVVNAVPFLTGIGVEQVLQEIADRLGI